LALVSRVCCLMTEGLLLKLAGQRPLRAAIFGGLLHLRAIVVQPLGEGVRVNVR
jgi:hypothetical protein